MGGIEDGVKTCWPAPTPVAQWPDTFRAELYRETGIHLTEGINEMAYARFGAMIATSTIVMFGLMYLNTYSIDHVFFSQTRMWMAFFMGAVMAVIMLSFMLGMYRDTRKNAAIFGTSIVVFAVALWLVRSQETVGDVSYMKAMIPHHSIAIMVSERAHIRDPRVRKLADGIIEAQVKEIAEMKQLIATLSANPSPPGATDLPARDAK
jgi:magnesium-transporting ATPase (P-type)